MSINDFMKKNEVAILVIADLETKTFDIRKSNIELKSDVLYKEFVLYNDVNALETYISGQVLMPRIFSQGNSLCFISQPTEKYIVSIFMERELEAKELYFFSVKIDKELKEIMS